jgi:hypothetical protein
VSDEDQAATDADVLPAEPSPDDLGTDDVDPTTYPAEPDDGLTPRERRELRLRLRAQRKRERRIWTGLVVAALAVLAVFLYAFWPVMAGRLAAAKQLDQAQALLEQAKPTVDEVDEVVTVQRSTRAAAGAPATAPQILVARRELTRAQALIDDAMPHLTDDEQKRAKLISTATQARLEMIDRAPAILVVSVKAVKAKALVDQAWKATQSASVAETAALANYETGEASSVASAAASLQRIRGQLGDAHTLYSQAASAFPEAGFKRYVKYVDLRNQGAQLLSHGAVAWLEGDQDGASMDLRVYKRTVANATSAAAKLPPAAGAPGQAFRKVAGPAIKAYDTAKQQALEAENALSGS